MDVVKWNDAKMSIGIDFIDDEHKQLLKIINDLATSIHNKCQRDDIVEILDRLIDYTSYHFSTEEKYFEKFNYENSVEHKEQHQIFLDKFRKIKSEINLEDDLCSVILSEEVFLYLIQWLLHHIAGSDKKYVKLFKENGLI